MANKYLNDLVKLSHNIIEKVIDSYLKKIQSTVDKLINEINLKVANEQAYDFDITIFENALLNMTMTKAPEINSNLIKLNFDGLFNSP